MDSRRPGRLNVLAAYAPLPAQEQLGARARAPARSGAVAEEEGKWHPGRDKCPRGLAGQTRRFAWVDPSSSAGLPPMTGLLGYLLSRSHPPPLYIGHLTVP